MADAGAVARYLDTVGRTFGERSGRDLLGGFNPFVTISREAGAGGRSLAEEVLEVLDREVDPALRGWQIFDQELCRLVAEDRDLRVSMRALLTEEYRNEVADYIAQFFADSSPQTRVVSKIFETVRSLAGMGRVVIVGRGGACLTRGFPHGVHVRLVAPFETRVRNVMEGMRLPRPDAELWVRRRDEGRAKLVRTYFQADIADPTLYDVIFNTARVPVDRAAAVVAGLLRDLAAGITGATSAPRSAAWIRSPPRA